MSSKIRRFLRRRARQQEKELQGWRGIVFNRAFAAVVFGLIVWFVQNPWAAVWVLAVLIAGVIAAVIIHFSHGR
jgi:fatty acid desaturase